MNYHHTQHAPLGWVLLVIATGLGGLSFALWGTPQAGLLVGLLAGAFVLLAASFWHLTVEDRGEHLSVRYGPLPIFGTIVIYSSITAVEVGRSSVIDGWGIHYIPGRGWTYNLWGWDCVVIRRGAGTLRIGTDDAAELAEFLQTKAEMSGRSRREDPA
jgi:hypothetical protein